MVVVLYCMYRRKGALGRKLQNKKKKFGEMKYESNVSDKMFCIVNPSVFPKALSCPSIYLVGKSPVISVSGRSLYTYISMMVPIYRIL